MSGEYASPKTMLVLDVDYICSVQPFSLLLVMLYRLLSYLDGLQIYIRQTVQTFYKIPRIGRNSTGIARRSKHCHSHPGALGINPTRRKPRLTATPACNIAFFANPKAIIPLESVATIG